MTISTLKDDLTGIIHGASLNKVKNIGNLINRAARQLLQDVDPVETQQLVQISNGIYDGIKDYAIPTDLKGDKVIDIRKQGSRDAIDVFAKTGSREFDHKNNNRNYTVESDNGSKVLRIYAELTGKVVQHDMDSLTSNGTWAGTNVSSFAADTKYKIQGGSSLKFNLDSTGGYIENSTMTSTDLETHDENSSWFVNIYIPDSTTITSFDLKWGNSDSVYWNRTITAPHFGSFRNGWNVLRFDWDGATETGTVDPTDIDYLRFTINGTADNNYRVDYITSNLPHFHDVLYYSKYLFKNNSGTWIESTTADTDEINLDTDSYNLLVFMVAKLAAQQISGEDSAFDYKAFDIEYNNALKKYKSLYPSQTNRMKSNYYNM